jgi:ArsR family transcriptional regulator, arsenate/arsenite/antimonite-responsive transcriptional repressor
MDTRKTGRLETLFRALADPVRLRILNLVNGREICVCYFVEIFGLVQPTVSRHLAYLRNAGIVAARRQGKWMHYRLRDQDDPAVRAILAETLENLRRDVAMQGDIARLGRVSCAPDDSGLPAAAPVPVAFRDRGRSQSIAARRPKQHDLGTRIREKGGR